MCKRSTVENIMFLKGVKARHDFLAKLAFISCKRNLPVSGEPAHIRWTERECIQQFQECHPGLIHKVIMGKYTVTRGKSHFDIVYWRSRYAPVSFSLSLSDCACAENSKGGGHVSLHAGIRIANNKKRKTQSLSERDTVCYDVTIDLPARGFSHLITCEMRRRPNIIQCASDERGYLSVHRRRRFIMSVTGCWWRHPSFPKSQRNAKGNRIHHPIKLLILLQCDSYSLALPLMCVSARRVRCWCRRGEEFYAAPHMQIYKVIFCDGAQSA